MTTNQLEALKKAAKNRKAWGRYATRQYVKRHGIHLSLYRLACQLEAAERAGK